MTSLYCCFYCLYCLSLLLFVCASVTRWHWGKYRRKLICREPPNDLNCVHTFDTLRPRHNGRHFSDDSFQYSFLNENVWISLKISLKNVPKVWINNILTLVEIMAWCWPGDKPLSETVMVSLPTHRCVTRPQWVNCVSINIMHIKCVQACFRMWIMIGTRTSHFQL